MARMKETDRAPSADHAHRILNTDYDINMLRYFFKLENFTLRNALLIFTKELNEVSCCKYIC